MSRAGWQRFETLIDQFDIHPILALVPENRDPELMIDSPDPGFWQRMRMLERAGATIALHGHQHLCRTRGRSMVPLHEFSEFSGIPFAIQRAWIHEGLETLRRYGLTLRLFVAPRHGFDQNTLSALRSEGIGHLSDGFARVPFVREGMMWIPQQLWSPIGQSAGLWTICVHSNTASDESVEVLRSFLEAYSPQFTSFDRICEDFTPQPLGWSELFHEQIALARIKASRLLKRFPPTRCLHPSALSGRAESLTSV
jgi:predicted deacetylase